MQKSPAINILSCWPIVAPVLTLTGDAEPLYTEDVPCSSDPIFAASAAHSILLDPDADVEVKLVEAAGGDHHAQLLLEVDHGCQLNALGCDSLISLL